MNSNTYYFELATLLYDHFGIDLYQKVFHGKYYLTVHDYLIGVSCTDQIKNILTLFQSLPNKQEVILFLEAAICRIIQNTTEGENNSDTFYKYRLKKT
ncbi:hypothetical protein OEV82_04770 [Caldibacillus thermolactis]|jgi:hypothetical protein|uniref:Uncharacterized protein n=1 Tax=Pallidibacillus thermolactis TaxID=251051 RepID=A0ABT2WDL1_9BACI|nr:hypothetical protein [Pallidibacillus thermolactis]MCU9593763.1 hypothetical protein [Pallidibacillus thermolactis]MCU9601296.1 hypothetical protein [Pallidibacillus thermolactis subsp. kokeshiiformis]MED1674898.1 hypothetical protein [Pallidibacillus thermolactis subsp. kokeshiiformis]